MKSIKRRGGNPVNDDQLSSFNHRSRHHVYEVIKQETWKVTLPVVWTVRLALPDPSGIYVKENGDIPRNTVHVAFNSKPVPSPVTDCCGPRCQFLDLHKVSWLQLLAGNMRSTILLIMNLLTCKQQSTGPTNTIQMKIY